MERRGIGHVEMILAFLLFLAATLSSFYFFNPSYRQTITESALSYTYNAILQNVSTNLDTYYVKIDGDKKFTKVNIDVGQKGVMVKNASGPLAGRLDGNEFCFVSQDNDFVTLYLSDDIDTASLGTPNCPSTTNEGNITSSIKEKVLSQERVTQLFYMYTDNYDALKRQLNIPQRSEFAFGLVLPLPYADASIDVSKQIPAGVNVFVKSDRIATLTKSGERVFADFYVRVW